MGKSTKVQAPNSNPADATTASSTEPSPPSVENATDFESFYLQQLTTEFADDLDKLRNASDFTDKSLAVLIEGLKSTAKEYSEEEKAKVMGKGKGR
ncbi:MAG: hypothetical protein Q9222_001554 [Ikaeria aurantiellina]